LSSFTYQQVIHTTVVLYRYYLTLKQPLFDVCAFLQLRATFIGLGWLVPLVSRMR